MPKFKLTNLLKDFVTKYWDLLYKIIFNIFCEEISQEFGLFIDLKKMLKMSSFRLHASPEAMAPLGSSTGDNPLIQSRPHTILHSSHIMATEQQSRYEPC